MRVELFDSLTQVSPGVPAVYDMKAPARLSERERETLESREEIIEQGLESFEQVGDALLDIRDGLLYRESHVTFEAYCRERWKMGARRARQITSGRQTVKALAAGGATVLPVNERQTRPLAGLEPVKAREIWDEAVEESGGEQPSSKLVKEKADRLKTPNSKVQTSWKHQVPEEFQPFDAMDLKHLNFEHALLWATVKASKLSRGWCVAWGYEYSTGDLPSARKAVEFDTSVGYEHSGLALLKGLQSLRDEAAGHARSAYAKPRTRKVAKLLVDWCGTEIGKVGVPAERGPAQTSELFDEDTRAAAASEREHAEASVFWLEAKEESETVTRTRSVARQVVEALGVQMDTVVDERKKGVEAFGQAFYFMECAKRECERILKESDRATDAVPKTSVDTRAQRRGRLAPGWPRGEAAEPSAEPKKAGGWVVARFPVKGSQMKRTRFYPGWGNDPRKGKVFASEAEARKFGRGGFGFGTVITLADALDRQMQEEKKRK